VDSGLFGAQEINPLLTGQSAEEKPLPDLLGNSIVDPFGTPGFPGFDGMSRHFFGLCRSNAREGSR
jgi:hypothetical protein